MFFAGVLICGLFIGCQKDKDGDAEQSQNATKNTILEALVVDASVQPISGASVKLYASESDWNNEQNVKATMTTNAQGRVKFEGLSAARYWVAAAEGCRWGGANTTNAIAAGKTTTINTTLVGRGKMVFNNTSSNKYNVYVDGTFQAAMNGNSTFTILHAITGAKTVRVVQQEGYLVYPTDKTYTGTLSCGGTLTASFP